MQLHALFIPACCLFILHQLLQKLWLVPLSLADQYLDPLLCMPILLGIWQMEQALVFKRKITPLHIWILTALLAVLFEIGFPTFSDQFTGDWKDALLYGTGTGLFLLLR